MAIQPRNTLKGWFVTFAKPVQSQFWDWIDSFRHKSEKITSEDLDANLFNLITSLPTPEIIDQLVQDLNNKADLQDGKLNENQWPWILYPTIVSSGTDTSFTILNGRFLEKIVLIPTADVNISIGNTIGSDDIQPVITYSANQAEVITVDLYSGGPGDRVIYFTGINTPTTLKFYLR